MNSSVNENWVKAWGKSIGWIRSDGGKISKSKTSKASILDHGEIDNLLKFTFKNGEETSFGKGTEKGCNEISAVS